jgi:hypothetical protein
MLPQKVHWTKTEWSNLLVTPASGFGNVSYLFYNTGFGLIAQLRGWSWASRSQSWPVQCTIGGTGTEYISKCALRWTAIYFILALCPAPVPFSPLHSPVCTKVHKSASCFSRLRTILLQHSYPVQAEPDAGSADKMKANWLKFYCAPPC